MTLTAFDQVRNCLAEHGLLTLEQVVIITRLRKVTARLALHSLKAEGEVVTETSGKQRKHRLTTAEERAQAEERRRFRLGEVWGRPVDLQEAA